MPFKIQWVKKKKKEKKEKVHIDYSKKLVGIVLAHIFIITDVFLVFCCYEMHKLQDLSSLSYIAPVIFGAFSITVSAALGFYNWRASQNDFMKIEIEKTKQLSELKEKYGDNFTYMETQEIETPKIN